VRGPRQAAFGAKAWDMVWNILLWPLMVAVARVAGLGFRLGWPVMPVGLFAVGVSLFGAGLTSTVLFVW
jgi:hypothetical protein